MATALDMTLDDLIKQNKKPSGDRRRTANAGAGGSGGPTRRAPNRSRNRSNPYGVAPKAPETAWKHDMYEDQAGTAAFPARAVAIETGTKINISNLDYGVSDEDIKELFAEVGDIKRSSINYDRSGRSLGTAVVVFARRADALEAIKRYHNVQLDGKPIKIELLARNVDRSAPVAPLASGGASRNLNSNAKSGLRRISAVQRQRVAGGRGQAVGRKRGRGRGGGGGSGNQKVSAADLDADLEKYHAGAMDTN